MKGNKEWNKFLALFKEEVVELNEQLKETRVNFFMELKDIQAYNEEITKLVDQLAKVKGQYKDMEQTFEKIR
jgi:hypothetical protein